MDLGAESQLREVFRSENVESIRVVVEAWIFCDHFDDDFGTISAYAVSSIGTKYSELSVYLYFLLSKVDQFHQVESLVFIWLRILLIC